MPTQFDPPSGTRDFLAREFGTRERAFAQIRSVFAGYGFEPLGTPAFERLDVLMGKYGDEGEKLIFKILRRGEHESSGEADLALRYDLTVPLARVAAAYGSQLPVPYKRYAMGPVWRADRPGHGRYREFLADFVRGDLVQLVERGQDPGAKPGRDLEGLQQARQHPAGVEQEPEAADAQPGQHVVDRADDLGVGQRRGTAQRVDVALGELAVPAVPGPVRPPDRAYRVPLVRHRQLAAVGGGHPGQWHRQVIAQRQVRLAAALVLAAAQDLEDELLALVPVLAHEDVEALERGGAERLEAVASEHRADQGERPLPGLELAGKKVTGTRRGIELRWHAPMFPDRAGSRHIGFADSGCSWPSVWRGRWHGLPPRR